MNQKKEEALLLKHLKDLSHISYQRGYRTYSDFLNINEISLFLQYQKDIVTSQYRLWGGYDDAERRVICFYEDDSSNTMSFPIQCLLIQPANKKFSDALNHRDYLGAILNLGIDRKKVGDIIVKDKEAYVFCQKDITPYIIDNLNRIKHTTVLVTRQNEKIEAFEPNFIEITGTVSSLRLDTILSVAFRTSRNSLTGLIEGQKVYVNNRLVETNSFSLKEGDNVSVRGMGKFVFQGASEQTKKKRYKIIISKYI
ncbi:YlmH family RNA-binding protein [Velocimicrobium porci]|uniref:RNA-binding protein n=1 Tax=Velocimicrobium porci TaxID=2606634 RepID=A0A6L5Y0I7_9FIRM|nr:YlmH/Sll1252 family protein [Velocimicrobium porci]MSS64389.1 RNA-binding protein [Velocimicrobium porci]